METNMYVLPKNIVEDHFPQHLSKALHDFPDYKLKIEDMAFYGRTTMTKICEIMDIQVYDCALPLHWVNDVIAKTGQSPVSKVVWCYDTARSFGEPKAISREGRMLLDIYYHITNKEV
jgi:hypothetical protein